MIKVNPQVQGQKCVLPSRPGTAFVVLHRCIHGAFLDQNARSGEGVDLGFSHLAYALQVEVRESGQADLLSRRSPLFDVHICTYVLASCNHSTLCLIRPAAPQAAF